MGLLREIRKTRREVCQLKQHCWVFLSQKDELVSMKSAKYFRANSAVKSVVLKQSTHFYYEKSEQDYLQSQFELFCATLQV